MDDRGGGLLTGDLCPDYRPGLCFYLHAYLVCLSIYFCVQLPERTNHRSFPANGRSGHSENVDKVSIRYTVYLCSFQKNGYASGHVLRCGPCFPQLSVAANLSYPAGFSDKRRPQFLRSASPQMGAAAAPIRGYASRCNSNAANRLRFPDSVFFLLFSIFTDGRLPE